MQDSEKKAEVQPMDPATLKALKGSIAKWEAIVARTGEDNGAKDCPLCHLFNTSKTPITDECNGCPVLDATGYRFCENTPHQEWRDYLNERGRENKVIDDYSRWLAIAELDFLKSLLPEGA